MEITYRNALLEDLPKIISIYNSTIPGRLVTADLVAVNVSEKTEWFHQHQSNTRPLWVAEFQNETIAWISFTSFYGRPAYDGTAEISLYIDEQYRCKGIGKKILAHAIQQSKTLLIHTLLGFIFEQNKASIALFKKAGFHEWGHLPDIALLDEKYCSLKIFGLKIN